MLEFILIFLMVSGFGLVLGSFPFLSDSSCRGRYALGRLGCVIGITIFGVGFAVLFL